MAMSPVGYPTTGGGGGGGESGPSDAYRQSLEQYQHLQKYLDLAMKYMQAIEGGGNWLKSGSPGGAFEPLALQTIQEQLGSKGMSPVEYAQAKHGVTSSFGAQTGALASGTAQGGYFSPSSVAQASMNAPAAGLASGLADLEAKNAELARKNRQAGINALTQLTPTMMKEARRPAEAFGQMVGTYLNPIGTQSMGMFPSYTQGQSPSKSTPGTWGPGVYPASKYMIKPASNLVGSYR